MNFTPAAVVAQITIWEKYFAQWNEKIFCIFSAAVNIQRFSRFALVKNEEKSILYL